MIELNLHTNTSEQELIKHYLEENVSEALAKKINNGVRTTVDGIELISMKTIDGFMKFAADEARKTVEKNANTACIEDKVVFGWVIHYFEEDSIVGTLYNLDGTEYKKVVKQKPKSEKSSATYAPFTITKPKEEQRQYSLFDMLEDVEPETPQAKEEAVIVEKPQINVDKIILNESNNTDESEEIDDEELEDMINEATCGYSQDDRGQIIESSEFDGDIAEPKETELPKGNPWYQQYKAQQEKYPEAIIAFRLGDFFEVFGNNAIQFSNKLCLTLTSRDCGLKDRIPMVGFPYHCADSYFGKILETTDLVIVDNHNETFLEKYKPEESIESSEDNEAMRIVEELFGLTARRC